MEKIKKRREYYFDPYFEDYTWRQVKEKCEAKDDYILISSIGFVYYEEETDEEYEHRMKIEKIKSGLKEKSEYDLYLKLKEKYENTRND